VSVNLTPVLTLPYTCVLVPDVQGGYAAEILELPGCFAEGETPDAAMQALTRAASAWIQAARAAGQTIPPPLARPGASGKIALRLPKSLHRKAAQLAARDGVSLNQWLVATVAARVGADATKNQLKGSLRRMTRRISRQRTRARGWQA
jgi:antitoxin HicB